MCPNQGLVGHFKCSIHMPHHNTKRSETVKAHCRPPHISPTAKGSQHQSLVRHFKCMPYHNTTRSETVSIHMANICHRQQSSNLPLQISLPANGSQHQSLVCHIKCQDPYGLSQHNICHRQQSSSSRIYRETVAIATRKSSGTSNTKKLLRHFRTVIVRHCCLRASSR